jgi:tetratricopeptide (TPR) repeat protein
LATFGRAKLILGDYDEAGRLLCRSSAVVESRLACHVVCPEFLPPYDGSLRFDIVLSRAELALNRGEFIETRELLALALAFTPPWIDRRIRHSLVSARYHFAIGRFGDACSCYKAARAFTDELRPPRYTYVIPAFVGMSHVESETSSWVNSIALATQAIRCLEEINEPISAEMVDALQALAAAYVRDDRSQEAKPLCDRARSLIAMTLKAGHPVEAGIQLLIAEYWISRRHAAEAIVACDRAMTLYNRYSPCDGYAQARVLRIEGEAHLVDRHPRCAAVLFGQALCCWNDQEKRLDCMHPEKSLIFLDIALTNISRGAIAEAETQYVMLKPWLCEFKGNAARAGFELNRRGNLLQALAMYDEADWLYYHAEELYCECYGVSHPFTCQVRANREIVKKRRLEACPPACVECR